MNDLALLSHWLQYNYKVDALDATSQHVDLKISKVKTKVIRTNNNQEAPQTIEGKLVNVVEELPWQQHKPSGTARVGEKLAPKTDVEVKSC